MKRILTDLLPLQVEPTRHRGIGQYTWQLVDALLRPGGPEAAHRLAVHPGLPPPRPFATGGAPWRVVDVDLPALGYLAETWAAHRDRYAAMWQGVIDAHAIDVLLVPSPFELVAPPHSRPARAQLALVVYDLIPLVFPEHYLTVTPPWYAARYHAVCDLVRQADWIITLSDCSRCDIIKYLGVDASRICIVPPGPSAFVSLQPPPDVAEAALRRRGLRGGYVLCTAGFDYRKNLQRALESYARLPDRIKRAFPLVVVFRLTEFEAQALRDSVRRLKLERHVVLTGFVPDTELAVLYRNATVLFFPSLYEGFGLPVLDAMAVGLPVVTSNVSSLPEVAGDAALLVDPYDVDAMSEALLRVLGDEPLRDHLRAQGPARVTLHTLRRVRPDLWAIIN